MPESKALMILRKTIQHTIRLITNLKTRITYLERLLKDRNQTIMAFQREVEMGTKDEVLESLDRMLRDIIVDLGVMAYEDFSDDDPL